MIYLRYEMELEHVNNEELTLFFNQILIMILANTFDKRMLNKCCDWYQIIFIYKQLSLINNFMDNDNN